MTCINFIQKLFVSDAQSNEQDGGAVAIHGDLAIVSAGGRDIGANVNQGAAYIFHRSDTLWIREATLQASDSGANDFFSNQPGNIVNAVNIFGNTAIVGAFSHDSDVQPNIGSAYIFTRSDNGTWTQTKQLFASDSASDMQFGISVALNDQFAAVAARKNGAVYIFQKSDVTWNYTQKLTSSDAVAIGYGQIALNGTTLIAGAVSDATNRGSAYIFTYDGAQWVQQTKLIPNDGTSGNQFGISVDVYCDHAVVGSWRNTSSNGAAYVFVRSDTIWTQQQKLTASDTNPNKNNARFGTSVTIDGRFITVGASRAASRGKTYLFQRTGSTWSQTDDFQGSDPKNNDQFGFACALNYPYLRFYEDLSG